MLLLISKNCTKPHRSHCYADEAKSMNSIIVAKSCFVYTKLCCKEKLYRHAFSKYCDPYHGCDAELRYLSPRVRSIIRATLIPYHLPL